MVSCSKYLFASYFFQIHHILLSCFSTDEPLGYFFHYYKECDNEHLYLSLSPPSIPLSISACVCSILFLLKVMICLWS